MQIFIIIFQLHVGFSHFSKNEPTKTGLKGAVEIYCMVLLYIIDLAKLTAFTWLIKRIINFSHVLCNYLDHYKPKECLKVFFLRQSVSETYQFFEFVPAEITLFFAEIWRECRY